MKEMTEINYPSTGPEFWKRTAAGLVLAISSAVLLTLAFPPHNLGLFIWVGFMLIRR